MARLTPVTDAELARYGTPQPEAQPAAEAESAADQPPRPTTRRSGPRSPTSAPRWTSWPSRRLSGALRWTRRPSTSRWCTSPRPSRRLSPHGSLAMLRATRSRRPRRTPSLRWRSASTLNSCAFADPGSHRYEARGCCLIYMCFETKAQLSASASPPGHAEGPGRQGSAAGAFGTVRCSAGVIAPTASAAACSQPRRT